MIRNMAALVRYFDAMPARSAQGGGVLWRWQSRMRKGKLAQIMRK